MCQPNQPILASFIGGTPNDTNQVIQKVIPVPGGNKIILMRFSQPPLSCTGTNSATQLSCYFPPAEYPAAKAIAQGGVKTLRVHGAGATNITQAAWSNT
jgi:hypothetical protein